MKSEKKSNDSSEFLEEKERILKKIGQRLKSLRKEKGYSSAEKFAYEHGIDRAQFNRYEQGLIDMQISSLIKLLISLEVDVVAFFGEGFDREESVERGKKKAKKNKAV